MPGFASNEEFFLGIVEPLLCLDVRDEPLMSNFGDYEKQFFCGSLIHLSCSTSLSCRVFLYSLVQIPLLNLVEAWVCLCGFNPDPISFL